MPSKLEWIEDTDALAREISAAAGPLCLDTEADSLHHYPEKVCLVQLTVGGRDLLIDPLAGVELEPLRPLLADPQRRKILHGADYDLRVLQRDFALELRGVFDTMIAARFVGEQAFGLAALLDKYLGVGLDKRFQRADWSRRPLPPEMQEYAVMDTRYLDRLAALLEARLAELGRSEWVQEEFRLLEAVRWSEGDDEGFRRVKGSGKLSPRQLALLRELVRMRERAARDRDRPPFKIMRDDVLLTAATSPPSRLADLQDLPGLPRGWSSGGRARRFLEAIRTAQELPDADLPARRRRTRRRLSTSQEERLLQLRAARDKLAEELDLEPSVLLSRALLERIVIGLDSGARLDSTADLRVWQAELIRPLLGRI